ncbi:MAG: response regulator [Bryobacteraceae bacterium]
MTPTVTPRTILIVEDSPHTAANLEIALSGVDGAEVRVASTGAEAMGMLEAAVAGGVAAVITDLEMPAMDGFELIEWMRALPRYARTPIIVASGSSDPDWPHRVLALGANACFPKPYSPRALRRKLELLLGEIGVGEPH